MRFPGGGRMRLRTFLRRLYEEYENDAVADSAAALGYYFVFSLFPFLFFLTTLTAFIPYIRRSVDTILARAHAILPEQAVGLIETHLRDLVEKPRPRLLDDRPPGDPVLGVARRRRAPQDAEPGVRRQGVAPLVADRAARVRHDHRGGAVAAGVGRPADGGRQRRVLARAQGRDRARVRAALALAPLAGHRARRDALRGARVLRAAGREAEVQVHHARAR